jgi:hypothetical protein
MSADVLKRVLLILLVLLVPVRFGQPAFSPNQQYFPRVLQLGFRATF